MNISIKGYELRRLENLKEVLEVVQGRHPFNEGIIFDDRLARPSNDAYQAHGVAFANGDVLVVCVWHSWPLSEVTPDTDMGVDYYYATRPVNVPS